MTMMWWHWLLIGLLLLGLELIFPSFPMVWLGLGGLMTGLFMIILPEYPVLVQAVFWVVVSLSCMYLWQRYRRPGEERKRSHRTIVRRR